MKKEVTVDMTDVVDETGKSGAQDASVEVVEGVAEREEKKAVLPARARHNGDGTITLPLLKPVTINIKGADQRVRSETYAELTFHELTGADLRATAQAKPDMQGITAFACSTKTPVSLMRAVFDAMSSRDVKAGSDILSFLSE